MNTIKLFFFITLQYYCNEIKNEHLLLKCHKNFTVNLQFDSEVLIKNKILTHLHQLACISCISTCIRYSYIYGLAVKYFLQDAGGKNIIHYI